MPSSTRKIGIIGVGFGAQVHVPGFRSEGWEVAAICSRNREKAQKAGAEAGIDAVYTDPMELIRRDDLAAVSIITPPGAHHELAIAALKAGKHVLCEKPFALDARQAKEMRDVAEKSRRTAMVAHEFRHTPQRA
ncbi:MAG TPA: Gfo/Idh/MocA family oxidoreductase, partial [Casimicrobiaceae bacterium]